jgi:iron complex transport system substrate-binding protein
LPQVSRPTFEVSGSGAEIDARVRAKLRNHLPLYEVDRELLERLAPDVVVTQVHCEVCAVSPSALGDAHAWPGLEGLKTVSMRGGSLPGILEDFQNVSRAIGRAGAGQELVSRIGATLHKWQERTQGLRRPKVVCIEWMDPVFTMGNWGPELVELAGGETALAAPGHSVVVGWEAVLEANPEILVVAPCGFPLERAWAEMPVLTSRPSWSDLRCVRTGRVYVSDGNRYFNRSGPTLFDSIGLLAVMLHPGRFPLLHQGTLYRRWED